MDILDENYIEHCENDEHEELSPQIKSELEFDKNMATILKFKEIIALEPEFIGINKLSSYTIYSIIENEINTFKKQDNQNISYQINQINHSNQIYQKPHRKYITDIQYNILNGLIFDLNFEEYNTYNIINIAKQIFMLLYV